MAGSFDPRELHFIWEPDNSATREALKALCNDPLFARVSGLSIAEERELTLRRLRKVGELGVVSPADFETNPSNIYAAHEVLGMIDGSLATKFTVQFNLFGGTIVGLGTERHRGLIPQIASLSKVGCFALTELGYGNNAVEMETLATWEPATQTFDIHTPRTLASKYWITNGAQHAHYSIVFARLLFHGKDEGIHTFLVRIRDDNLSECEGVEIEDMGKKLGLNGLDNARLRFTHVKVPREAMLNRYSNVDAQGQFTSQISKKRDRFLKVADRLLSGRICIASMMNATFKLASYAGFKFSQSRLTSGPKGKVDTPLIEMQLQQQALIPPFARLLALNIGLNFVKVKFQAKDPEIVRLCCAIKPLMSWSLEKFVCSIREKTGCYGLLEINMIKEAIAGSHSGITAEGDNAVLMMKVTSEMMKAHAVGQLTIPEVDLQALPAVPDFDSLELLVELLKAREVVTLQELLGSIQAGLEQGKPLFQVLMHEESDRIQMLAKSYGERVCAVQVLETIRANARLAGVLSLVGLLFAYDTVRSDLSWFLMHSLISPAAASNIEARWEDTTRQLKPHVWKIVESFEIPAALLNFPIATDIAAYYGAQLQPRL
jgi:acyl-CoA oxidase